MGLRFATSSPPGRAIFSQSNLFRSLAPRNRPSTWNTQTLKHQRVTTKRLLVSGDLAGRFAPVGTLFNGLRLAADGNR